MKVTTVVTAALTLLCVLAPQWSAAQNDFTEQEEASGTAVVLLSVARIQQSGIFAGDNGLLRRIAYVETRDGIDPATYREDFHGGIWAVTESAFQDTKNLMKNPRLPAKFDDIKEHFGIEWSGVDWNDLRKPLYSATAANLVLYSAPEAIPEVNDIQAQAEYWEAYYNLMGSVTAFTGAARELEGNVLESTAGEFFLGFAMNVDENPPQTLRLFVTTPEPNPVSFTVDTLTGFSFTGTATSNSTTTVTLPADLQVSDSSERNKGIRVKTEDNKGIVVYGLNYEMFSSDAFLALPCDRLAIEEYEYYAVSYQGGIGDFDDSTPSNILVVGCEDDTTFTVSSDTITLNQLETYLLQNTGDLTGTKIVSNKPITVFTGIQCTNIPFGVRACDTLIEQVPPTNIWGSFFLSASFLGRSSGERYRILTGHDSTTVTIDCTTFSQPMSISLVNAGSWEEFATIANSFCSIEANHPVLVMEFSLGGTLDDDSGDPMMTMVPPVEQNSNNYVFDVLPEFSTNYITVFVASEYFQSDQIFVDSSNLQNSEWTSVSCSDGAVCGYITRVPLDFGQHQLYHENAAASVGVLAYGFNTRNSYGYPGGLQLVPIQLATVSFAASTYTVAESADSVTIQVIRSGDTEVKAVVLVASENFVGTASAGIDYKVVIELLEFQPGETEKEVTVEINDDSNVELKEEFELYLTSGAGVHLSPFSRAKVVITDDDGKIVLEPSYGSVIGGTAVTVSGDFIFESSDEIMCTFDGIEVEGIYIDTEHALCVTPRLTRTGRVPFQIAVSGKLEFIGETTFTSLSYTKAYEVYIDNNDLLFQSGTTLGVHWSPRSIFPQAEPGDYTVDILLLELDTATEIWNELAVLASDLPNIGFTQVTIPELEIVESVEGSISPVVVQVSVSSASTDENNTGKRQIISNLFKRLGKLAWKVVKNAPIRYATKLVRQAAQRTLCELWGASQPPNIGQEILDRLPECPRTAAGARAQNSGFKEETLSSVTPVIDGIQDFFETTIIDDEFREFFHPGTSSCFRQRVTDSSQTGGSGQQCCYGMDDQLVVGPPGGGTVDKVSPDVSFEDHFLEDVVPFLLCCKAGIFSDCEEYYEHRPSDTRPLTPPPPPAWVVGDPHIVTLDSHKYTFNGKGEFTLIETVNGRFTLQGRMIEATDINGTAVSATVFSAVVGKENNSDTVQFELTENATLIALVNGEQADFTSLLEQEYTNVVVSDLGNNTLSASFSSGGYLEARVENGIISVLIVSLPKGAEDTPTRGLMGSFNGDKSDDLLPKAATDPLPLNATLQEIHEQFGVTWIIDTPTASLFTYQPGENWATYYDPYFISHYTPTFSDPSLEAEAVALCGDDQFCLFDIAATGNMDIGLSTLEGGQEFERIVEFSIPVVCDPPCENGACVANETCNCAAGYVGDRCTEPVFMPCDESPCQNGGNCTRHVIDYLCECPPGYSGSFCENELESEDDKTAAFIGGVVGIAALVLIVEMCVVVVVIVMRKSKALSSGKKDEMELDEVLGQQQ